jgi:NADH-quinone oxidoreductase subunit M
MHLPYILSLIVWIPVVAGLVVLFAGSDAHPGRTRWLALAGALAGLAPTIPLVTHFQENVGAMQFVEQAPWLPAWGISWHLAVDGISLWFVALTALTTVIVVVASWESVKTRSAQYFGAFLMLSGFMQGVFTSMDGMLFFMFFEATLIPLFLLIGSWGRTRRIHAAVKFFFFSFAGSLPMLVALIYLGGQAHSFDLAQWYGLKLGFLPELLVFLGFLAAFSVKVPMWPVHTWLPDVHLDGPTGVAVMIGMLKIGGYGLLRFALPIVPDACHFFAPAMIALSIVAVIYASLVALAQKDISGLLAYSSVSHMGLVTLGIFLFDRVGTEGAVVQMLSYGIISGAMLLCSGMLYDRTQSSAINTYGGVANPMPKFATFAMLFSMANLGLPGTAGFVGEFMILLDAIRFNFWIGALAASTLVLSAAYTLWMYKRVVFGAIANATVAKLADLGRREFVLLGVMALLVLTIGVDPKLFTNAIDSSTDHLYADVITPAQAPALARTAGGGAQAAQTATSVKIAATRAHLAS